MGAPRLHHNPYVENDLTANQSQDAARGRQRIGRYGERVLRQYGQVRQLARLEAALLRLLQLGERGAPGVGDDRLFDGDRLGGHCGVGSG